MILTCPQCATRYLLPAHTLAPDGRRVKCSGCHNVWFQLPDIEEIDNTAGQRFEEIPEGVKPLPEGSNLPTVHEEEARAPGGRGRVMGYAAAAAVFFAVFAGLVMFQATISQKISFSRHFYAMIGHEAPVPGKNLAFSDVAAEAKPDSAGEKISITGKILNSAGKQEQIPMIEAQMKNEAGDILERWIIRPPAPSIEARSDLAFKTDYLIATPGAAVNIGLQFLAPQN